MTTIGALVDRAITDRSDQLALVDAPNRASFFSGDPLRLTWAELDRAVDSVAAGLQDAGVRVGDAVGIQLPNVVELPVSILACIRIGAIATPFAVQHREHELRHGLTASGARYFITAARPDRHDLLDTSGGVLAEFNAKMLTFGEGRPSDASSPSPVPVNSVPVNSVPVNSVPVSMATNRTAIAHQAQPSDVATICWTSGTTGVPKGVPRTNAMWLASSGFHVTELDLDANDRILCPFPVVNMAGIGGMLMPWLVTASALFLHNPIDLDVFLSQISTERITYSVAPPPLLNRLLRNRQLLEGVDLTSIRKITSGSAPLDPWMVEGWQERGIEIVNAFGSNEGASMLSTAATVPDPTQRARYFPVPNREGVEVRLVDLDTDGDIDEPGRPGELRFQGVSVFSGYLDSDGAEFDDRGFYRTGDIFEIVDAPGPRLVRFVDRAKDIVIRGGMNISAAEVEAMISSHDAVAECAVIPYPDAELGERVGVFVVARPEREPTLDDLLRHLRGQKIASYKLPERCELIDALPRNPVGKIIKGELRRRWAPLR